MKSPLASILLCLSLALTAITSTAWAQQAPSPDAPSVEDSDTPTPWPTLELARAYLAQVESQTDLEPSRRDELTGIYQSAIADLEGAAQANAQARSFDENRISAPQRLADIRQQLASLSQTSADADLSGDLSTLETRLANVRQEFDSFRTQRDTQTSEAARRAERLTTLPALIAAKRDELRSIDVTPNGPPAQADSTAAAFANQVGAAAKRQRLAAELRLMEAEQASYTARAELLTARREYADRMTTRLSRQVEALQQEVTRTRTAQAEAQAQQSRSKAEELPRALADAARENAALAEKLAGIQRQIGEVAQRSTESKTQLGDIRSRLEKFEEPQGDLDLDRWLGVRLRSEVARLPNVRQLKVRARQLRDDISSIRRQQFELSDALLGVSGNLDSRIQELLEAAPQYTDRIESIAEEIAQTQLDTLRSLDSAYNELLSVTLELASALEETANEVEQFEDFIERRILWVRSDDSLRLQSFSATYRAAASLVAPENWSSLPDAAAAELRSRFLRHAAALAMALLLVVIAPQLRAKARQLDQSSARSVRQRMLRTLLALATLIVASLAIPAAMLVLAQFLFALDVAWVFAVPFGAALIAVAILLFAVQLVLGLCRAGGIGERDFRWPADARKRTMRVVRAWALFGLIVAAARNFFLAAASTPGANEASRIFIMIWLILLTWLAWRLVRRDSPVMRAFWGSERSSWAYRLWPFVSFTAIVGPLVLAAAAGFGYTYTASQLAHRISASVLAILALIITRAIVRRWLILQRRQLAVEQLRAEQMKSTTEPASPSDLPPVLPTSDSVDLAHLGEQTSRLIRVGGVLILAVALLLIWANLLPALGILQDIRIDAFQLTLGDVLGAVLVGVLTFAIARNAPGLLEIAVLRRIPLDAGGRYAVTSLLRYTIVLIGVVAAGAALGLKWSSVQWLAAAATVGLGFGLQEIFANFVSGLIILFERPLRVGDTVTVGSLTGTVTKIRIRATTILDWDRKEIIIPNKDFITSQLINWTLTDSVLRIIVTVGVAYGSDTELVERLLMKLATESPNILNDPPPYVYFKDFGDSALTFDLRFYLPNMDKFIATQHQIRNAIDREFRAHDVEIAFPQRDLHIRSIPRAIAESIARNQSPRESPEAP